MRGGATRFLATCAAVCVALAASACGDLFFRPAERGPADVRISYAFAAPPDGVEGGPAEAFAAADAITVRVTSQSGGVLYDETLPLSGDQSEVAVNVDVGDGGALTVDVVVLAEGRPLFAGSGSLTVRPGETGGTTITLSPIAAGVAIDAPGDVAAYEEPVQLHATAVFATGDSIPGSSVAWSSLDPQVATVSEAGVLVAHADGTARIVARAVVAGTPTGAADTASVRVHAEVATVTVAPASARLAVGGTQAFAVTPEDRNGNPIVGRAAVWTVDDAAVASVDAQGVARAVRPGATVVHATVDAKTGDASLAVVQAPIVATLAPTGFGPETATFLGTVTPFDGPVEAWFEWGFGTALDRSTQHQPIPPGAAPVPFSQMVSPGEGFTYSVRAVAANGGVVVAGQTITFTEPYTLPPAPVLDGTLERDIDGIPVQADLTWTTTGDNATEFRIERKLSFENVFSLIAVVGSDVRSYQEKVANLDSSTFLYRITACNPAGCSDFSNVVTLGP